MSSHAYFVITFLQEILWRVTYHLNCDIKLTMRKHLTAFRWYKKLVLPRAFHSLLVEEAISPLPREERRTDLAAFLLQKKNGTFYLKVSKYLVLLLKCTMSATKNLLLNNTVTRNPGKRSLLPFQHIWTSNEFFFLCITRSSRCSFWVLPSLLLPHLQPRLVNVKITVYFCHLIHLI